MKVLATEVEIPGASQEDVSANAKSEAGRVWDLHRAGTVREVGFRRDRAQAGITLESTDSAGAETILKSLAFVQRGLSTFLVIILRPYAGSGRLFPTTWGLRPSGEQPAESDPAATPHQRSPYGGE